MRFDEKRFAKIIPIFKYCLSQLGVFNLKMIRS